MLRPSTGAGVPKVQRVAAASAPPTADRVPAGTSTRYSVAIGKRTSGSNRSVLVPTQRQRPGGCGSRRTGTPAFASSSCDVTATIGCENVTDRFGDSGTSPSGAWRRTASGPAATGSGVGAAAAAGTPP